MADETITPEMARAELARREMARRQETSLVDTATNFLLPGASAVRSMASQAVGEGPVDTFEQGASMNAIDELKAATRPIAAKRLANALYQSIPVLPGLVSGVSNPQDFDNAWNSFYDQYTPNKEDETRDYLAFKKSNPNTSFAIEAAGSALPATMIQGAILPTVEKEALNTAQILKSLPRSTVGNAAQGAVSGLMSGDGASDRLSRAMMSGGVAGLMTPIVGVPFAYGAPYAQRIVKTVGDSLKTPSKLGSEAGVLSINWGPPERPPTPDVPQLSPGELMLAKRLEGVPDADVYNIAGNLNDMQNAGVPIDAGSLHPELNLQASNRALANRNSTAYGVRKGLLDRDKGQLYRLYKMVDEVSPITTSKQEGAGLLKKAAQDRIQQEHDFLHGKVIPDGSTEPPAEPGASELVYHWAVSNQPKLTDNAQAIINEQLRNDPVAAAKAKAQQWEPYKSMPDDSSQLAHQTKKVLNDKIQAAKATPGSEYDVGQLTKARNAYRSALRDGGPEYSMADEFYAAAKDYINELESGPVGRLAESQALPLTIADNLMKMSPDEVKAVKYALGESNWDKVKNGAAAALKDTIDNTRAGYQQIPNAFRTPEAKARLVEIFGPDDADTLIKRLEGEMAITQNRQRILGNSATSDTMIANQALNEDEAAIKAILKAGRERGLGPAAMEMLASALQSDKGKAAEQEFMRIANSMGKYGPEGLNNDMMVQSLHRIPPWRTYWRDQWAAQRSGAARGRALGGAIGTEAGAKLVKR